MPEHRPDTQNGALPMQACSVDGETAGLGTRANTIDGSCDASAAGDCAQGAPTRDAIFGSQKNAPAGSDVSRVFLCAPSLIGRTFQCVDPDAMHIGDLFTIRAVSGWEPSDWVIGVAFDCMSFVERMFMIPRSDLQRNWVEVAL